MRGLAGATLAILVLLAGFAVNPTAASGPSAAGAATASTLGRTSAAPMSQERLTALAEHLRDSGAAFYGAYWCPHCQEQKQAFGSAADQLPYVECDPRGAGAQPARCEMAGVRAYPTWVIGRRKIEGAVPPADLARLSGFRG
jgi:hypothetical protein